MYQLGNQFSYRHYLTNQTRKSNKQVDTKFRGVINGKAGKAAALPKFSDTLTLSQPGEGCRLCPSIGSEKIL